MSTAAFYHLPGHGHINPTLPVMTQLVQRGERVIAYATPDLEAKIAASGAEFRAYPSFPFDHNAPPPNLGIVAASLLAAALEFVPRLLADARKDRLDYVMHDSMAPWGPTVAQVLRRPSICSTSTFALVPGTAGSPKLALIKSLLLAQAGRSLPAVYQNARTLARTYGVRRPGFFDVLRNRADLNLVYTSRQFQPGAEWLDESYRFCGPSIRDEASGNEPLLAELEGPLVYASLGTLFNNRRDFFRTLLDALADFDGRVLLSIGSKLDPKSFGTLPRNAVVRSHVPQLAVLERASLFITHGGMNSVSEALYYGVPMLVFPQAGDQMMVAGRVAELGAGERLHERDLTVTGLRAKALGVLRDDSYRARARALGASLKDAGGTRRVIEEIEAFKRRHGVASRA